jgi:hypothetical protein
MVEQDTRLDSGTVQGGRVMDSYERGIRAQVSRSKDPRSINAVWDPEQGLMLLPLPLQLNNPDIKTASGRVLSNEEMRRYPARYQEPEKYLAWDGQLKKWMSDREYKQLTPWDFDAPEGWYIGYEFESFSGDPNRPPNPKRPADGSIREHFIVNEMDGRRAEGAD